MTVHLVYVDIEEPIEFDIEGEQFALRDGLHLIATESSRSRLYHDIKWQLPEDTALLVGPLDGPPKFKGMPAGALTFLRDVGAAS